MYNPIDYMRPIHRIVASSNLTHIQGLVDIDVTNNVIITYVIKSKKKEMEFRDFVYEK